MDQLRTVVRLLELKSLAAEADLKASILREKKIRSQISGLQRRGHETEFDELNQFRALGGDVRWKAWSSSAISNLNIELARNLAIQSSQRQRNSALSAQLSNALVNAAENHRKTTRKHSNKFLSELISLGSSLIRKGR